MFLIPNNWEDLQHYKDRSPPWIKLHKKLLDNYEFQSLPVASRALAPMLWLLASDHEDGHIDATPKKLAFRLRMTEQELTEALNPLIDNGFFSPVQDASKPLANPVRDAIPETETETETETEKKPRGRAAATTSIDGVPGELLADYLAVRRAKKAGPLTETAIAGLKREAAKAGLTLEQAITSCVEFSWQGFNAKWYAERNKGSPAAISPPKALPQWCIDAGFEHIAEAENARCHIGNYREFRGGKRIAEQVAA